MKTHKIILIMCGFLVIPHANGATGCSRANLTRCLDSACAINVSSNPAARCQYCGTASAGTPPTASGMRSVSAGTSAKYNLTDKELKSAPADPGDRYAWATAKCVAKVTGCTVDDVTDAYDSLIEQSCKAAGISAQMATLQADARKKKTKSSCNTSIRACMVASDKCGSDWRACEKDADFDKFFSTCGVASTGCDSYLASIRTDMAGARDSAIASAASAVSGLVASYKSARDAKLASATASCKDNASRDACIESVCANNMRNHCEAGFESEHAMAVQLCKFYELACAVLK